MIYSIESSYKWFYDFIYYRGSLCNIKVVLFLLSVSSSLSYMLRNNTKFVHVFIITIN